MKNKKLKSIVGIFFLMTILFMGVSVAKSSDPVVIQDGLNYESGLQIVTPLYSEFDFGQEHYYYIKAYDKSNGVIIPNTELFCNIQILDNNGVLVLDEVMNNSPINEFEKCWVVNETFHENAESYSTYHYCEQDYNEIANGTIGGFYQYTYDIVDNTKDTGTWVLNLHDTGNIILLVIVILSVILMLVAGFTEMAGLMVLVIGAILLFSHQNFILSLFVLLTGAFISYFFNQ